MKSKETPTNGSHNKLRSQIENVVVLRYNERNKIYNSCTLQLKQIIGINIILRIVINFVIKFIWF